MAASDPPSPPVLAALHYLQDACNYGRTWPETTRDAYLLQWYFIKRLLGWPVEWPLPQIAGLAGVQPPLAEVAGVTSIKADALAALIGDVVLASGAGILLSEAGQTITVSASGGLSSLVLFDSTLGADAAAIDTGANGIAQTAQSLLVQIIARTSQAAVFSDLAVTFNGDTGANYDRNYMQVLNATVSGFANTGLTNLPLTVAGDSTTAGNVGIVVLYIHGYRQTTFQKQMAGDVCLADNVAANSLSQRTSGHWRSTAAVTQMAVAASSGNLRAGSRVTVYGLL